MQRPQQRPEPPRITGFRDLVRVAAGGFSTVYTAHQEALGRTVAVKVLHADAQDPAARERFQHECELTGRLTGQPHIITVFGAGTTEDARFYIAMQYLPSGSLAERLAATGPLPPEQVVRIGIAVAGALQAAHSAGILHGDIKPGNILLSDHGEPVLSDFGIASLINPTGVAGADAFTRAHAAPELVQGQAPSARSDIYAVGSTLYTLRTGVPPGDGQAEPDIEPAPGDGPAHPSDPTRRDISAGLDAVLRRALAADAHQRPATAAELAAQLAALLGQGQVLAGLAQAAPSTIDAPAAGPATTVMAVTDAHVADEATRLRADRVVKAGETAGRSERRQKRIIAATVAVATLALAATAMAAVSRPDDAALPLAAQTTSLAATSAAPAPAGPDGSAPAQQPAPTGGGPAQRSDSAPAQPPAQPGQSPTQSPAPKPSTTKPAPTPPTVCTTGGCAGSAYFVANGDHLFVCDDKSDGYGVIAQYTRTDVPGQNNEAANRGGWNTCVDHNMNMAEGTKLTFRVCLVNKANERFACSGYITVTK